MINPLPKSTRVVIIGGGIVGCATAYHLAKEGWADTVLLERKQLTCGTTWHAAGLVSETQAVPSMSALAKYSLDLMERLEAETGQATGFKRVGSISVATNAERLEELRRKMDYAYSCDLEAREISIDEVLSMWPSVDPSGLLGAVHFPNDGQANPIDTTMALAKGAQKAGARIVEEVTVLNLTREGGRVVGVETDRGPVQAEFVVNCAGMWAYDLGLKTGTDLPLFPCQHFYVVTDPVADLPGDLPVLRVMDEYTYYKEDAGRLLIGCSEPHAVAWDPDGGIPDGFCFDELPCDEEHLLPILEMALKRVPALQSVGIRKFFNGPECFTADALPYLGEVPNLDGYFVAVGFNSTGLQNGPGAGKAVAEWIIHSHPTVDLADVDVRRVNPFQANRSYIRARAPETLSRAYAMHWPYLQPAAVRGLRRTPFYDRLMACGACFGEVAGWERPMWYARDGMEAQYTYGFGRQNWFACWEAEHRAVREDLGLIDLTMGKFLVQGADAEAFLQHLCANDVGGPTGQVTYTQWLNERAGIEADVTVTRLGSNAFMVITSAASTPRDWGWINRHLPKDGRVTVTDVTSAYAVLGIMGPRAREFLSAYTDSDLSNEAFSFASSREIEIGYAKVRAQRITYVGELGWEIHVATEFAAHVFDVLMSDGAARPPQPVGGHAVDSLRTEKAYRHWGHDIAYDDTPLEAGLAFACKPDKPGGFIGRDALVEKREQGIRRRLLQFVLDDPKPLLFHNEPIFRKGRLVGRTTSATYGHTLGAAVALGYVSDENTIDLAGIEEGPYEIGVAGRRVAARASLRPLYDPRGERVRS